MQLVEQAEALLFHNPYALVERCRAFVEKHRVLREPLGREPRLCERTYAAEAAQRLSLARVGQQAELSVMFERRRAALIPQIPLILSIVIFYALSVKS